MLVTKTALATVLFLTAILQSCVGSGDMFAEKRTVVGDYFLMTDEGDQRSYYLFRRGKSGSITGTLHAIGWDKHFILAEDNNPESCAVFAINPQRDPVPTDATSRCELLARLRKAIVLRSPAEVWVHSSELGSWFTRPFS
jgi:hypothetical protein